MTRPGRAPATAPSLSPTLPCSWSVQAPRATVPSRPPSPPAERAVPAAAEPYPAESRGNPPGAATARSHRRLTAPATASAGSWRPGSCRAGSGSACSPRARGVRHGRHQAVSPGDDRTRRRGKRGERPAVQAIPGSSRAACWSAASSGTAAGATAASEDRRGHGASGTQRLASPCDHACSMQELPVGRVSRAGEGQVVQAEPVAGTPGPVTAAVRDQPRKAVR
jgi:hypothetical protein